MGFAPRTAQASAALLATAATGLLFYFGNGLHPVWPLMWIAPIPVLLFAFRSRWSAAAPAAIVAMAIGMLNLWGYLVHTLGAPAGTWLSLAFVSGLVFAAGVLLTRALVRRGALWSALIALPAVWTSWEYVRNCITPHGSAGSLAYSQLRFLPFLQLASITGPWGMTFVLLLFSSALAIALHLRLQRRQHGLRVLGAGIAVVAAALMFGAVRLALPLSHPVRVGLVTSDTAIGVRDAGAATRQLFGAYADAARKLTAQGAQAIVIPEKLGTTREGGAESTDAVMQSLADQSGATIVAGVVHTNPPDKFNEAHIYIPHAPMRWYDKEHMLPPFESDLKPGTELVTLPRRPDTWGVAICKDMDFSSPARRYGKLGVGLMLVPGWDFVVDGAWHGHIAIMRGVEDGFSVARAAKQGFLTVSDNRGRILGEVSSASAPFATLLVDVPAAHSWTLYPILGDWFAWLAIALLALTVARLLRTR